MDVEIARTAEAVILEMMIFEIGQRVAHVGLAGEERLLPDHLAFAANAAHAFDAGRRIAHEHLRADGRMAELGVREIEIVLALGDMVGIFIAQSEAQPQRAALGVYHVETGKFRLLAAVEREGGLRQRPAGTDEP